MHLPQHHESMHLIAICMTTQNNNAHMRASHIKSIEIPKIKQLQEYFIGQAAWLSNLQQSIKPLANINHLSTAYWISAIFDISLIL